MAPIAFINGYVSLTGTNLSAYCKQIGLDIDVADLDTTTFGSGGSRERIGGLKDGSLSLTFNQDITGLDAVMWPLIGQVVTFEVRATQAAVGAGNPKYTGSVLVAGWTPLDGKVGALLEVSVDFPVSGPVTRATS